jgi:glycine cleavage system H protein|tara:strand:- start:2017 stop:2433 length:417 start_codon:yes stop_codon:yes gene_type:complete
LSLIKKNKLKAKLMRTINELKFSQDHVWLAHIESNKYHLGITDFAQDLLGDIVFVDIKLNVAIPPNSPLGIIESVKTASDIVSPANIKVIGLNPLIEKSPETINDKPYETWICEITLDSDVEIDNLLNYEHYLDLIKE